MIDLVDGFGDYLYGDTTPSASERNTVICISLELIEPLLNDQITPAEKMISVHMLAVTIVHELSVMTL